MISKKEFKAKMRRGLKVCVLGNTGNNFSDIYSWFVRTTTDGIKRLGNEVICIDWKSNTTDNICLSIYKYRPDILFTHMTFHGHHPIDKILNLFNDIRVNHNTIVIHTLQDARKKPRCNFDISKSFDLGLVGQLENLEKFSNIWNISTFYWPYSSMYQEKMAEYDKNYYFDAPVFTGTPYIHNDRKVFIQNLQRIMPIYIIRTQSENDLRNKTAELSASTSCILGLCTGYDINGYIDVRPFQYLGAGAFMISRKFINQERIIPDNLYVPFYDYDNPEIIRELYLKWEAMPEEKMKMKERAFNYMQKHNNNIIRCKQALRYILEAI